MRNKIAIQEFVEGVNENGYPVEDWETKYELWAKIKTLKGSEFVKAATEVSEETYRFIVRYHGDLHTKQRILFNNRLYDIQAVLNDDELHNTQTIVAILQVS